MSSGTLSSDRVLAFPQPACFGLWERRTLEPVPELSYGRTASFDRTTALDRILSCDRTTGVLAFIRLPKYNCRTVVRHPPSAWYDAPSASCDRSTGARIYRVATILFSARSLTLFGASTAFHGMWGAKGLPYGRIITTSHAHLQPRSVIKCN